MIMTVKDYQNLPINNPKENVIGTFFRPKVDYGRMEAGKNVPIYEVIKVTEVSFEYKVSQVKLV